MIAIIYALMHKVNKDKVNRFLSPITPHYWAESVTEIDYAQLKKSEITTVVFDVDSTLVDHDDTTISADVSASVRKAVKTKSIRQVVLATNRRKDDFAAIREALGQDVKFIHAKSFFNAKPFPAFYKRLDAATSTQPSECIMVGDKLITDVLGANMHGMKTLHVDQLGKTTLARKLSLFRIIEKYLSDKYRKR